MRSKQFKLPSCKSFHIIIIHSSVFRGRGMRPWPPLGTSETDKLLKMGFQIYIFCSKVPSKCRKCRFRDPHGLLLTKILATPLIIHKLCLTVMRIPIFRKTDQNQSECLVKTSSDQNSLGSSGQNVLVSFDLLCLHYAAII